MFLSRNTVKSEATAIYRKLGASSRNEAVTQARTLGLLEGLRGRFHLSEAMNPPRHQLGSDAGPALLRLELRRQGQELGRLSEQLAQSRCDKRGSW
jgi:hypothetical protein